MSDTREISGKGFTYMITRRFLPGTERGTMRVRVRIYKGMIAFGTPETNEYRDYTDMHEGDAVFAKHINKITAHVNSKG
jgi:hypothetical protein